MKAASPRRLPSQDDFGDLAEVYSAVSNCAVWGCAGLPFWRAH